MTTFQTKSAVTDLLPWQTYYVFFYLARYGQLSGLVEPFAGVLGAALGKTNFFIFFSMFLV